MKKTTENEEVLEEVVQEKPKPAAPVIPAQKPKTPAFHGVNNFGKWGLRNNISKQRPGRAAARGR